MLLYYFLEVLCSFKVGNQFEPILLNYFLGKVVNHTFYEV